MLFSEEIIKVFDDIFRRFGVAVDWTQQNLTPKIQDLCIKIVNYELWTSIAWLTIAIGCIFLGMLVVRKLSKGKGFDWDDLFMCAAPTVCVIIIFICCAFVIVALVQIFDIVTCMIFPEKVLWDFVTHVLAK